MTYILHMPCTAIDLAEVVERSTGLRFAMLRAQLDAGKSFVLRDGFGVAVACGGFVELESGVEGWFAVNPVTGPKAMRLILRLIALTLKGCGYPAVNIEAETPVGARLAQRLGFRPAGTRDGKEIWQWQR